jgi:GNAT superfamily N-acetyltransferase
MVPRKLSYLDKSLLSVHLIGLSEEDKRLRFGMLVSDDYIKKYVSKSINDTNSQWFAIEDESMLVAVCHAAVDSNGDAELGFSVDEDYRNCGYAQALFDRAVRRKREEWCKECVHALPFRECDHETYRQEELHDGSY